MSAYKEIKDKGFQEGLGKGKAASWKRGRDRGFTEGFEAGEKLGASKAAKRVVENMLSANIELTTISQFTGLSLEELREF